MVEPPKPKKVGRKRVKKSPTLSESEKRLDTIVNYIKEKKKDSGIKLLWGTAN